MHSKVEYQSHLTVLQNAATQYSTKPALKIPCWSDDSLTFKGWKDISFSQFLIDVESSARYWANECLKKGLKRGSIIGAWIGGGSYEDICHIWGLARAGLIPHLISLDLSSEAVCRFLKQSGAEGIVYDANIHPNTDWGSLPSFPRVEVLQTNFDHLPLPELSTEKDDMDTVMIFNTSGSTSGTPKTVPYTAKFVDFLVEKAKHFPRRADVTKAETLIISKNFCYVGGTAYLIASLLRGNCVVIPPKSAYSFNMLQRMVDECGATTLTMNARQAGALIRESRNDPSLLSTVKAFHFVTHGGLPIDTAEETWALENGINLINRFGSTELSVMLQSTGGQGPEATFLSPLPGTAYEFVPVSEGSGTSRDDRLLELVVLPESPDCPHPLLRNKDTNKFHTGDMFVEVVPGRYLFRGRNDDFINLGNGGKTDARYIEDNVMDTCGHDLVSAAVVVGRARPSVALIVEPKENINVESDRDVAYLQSEILRRITPFHEKLYLSEQVKNERFIKVVSKGVLPRAELKGNIQRRLAEDRFKKELDLIYSN